MNWDAIGAVGEIFGAIAVLATLVYLARQISQGVYLARATQNKAIFDSYNDFNNVVLANSELAGLLDQMEQPTRELSSTEKVQLRHLAYRFANIWVSAEISYSNGQLSGSEFATYKDDARVVLNTYPGLMPYMATLHESYPSNQEMEVYAPIREYLATMS